MRDVLVRLELLSNGSIARMDASPGGGNEHPSRIPVLGQYDAPHLFWSAEWKASLDDARREVVLRLAKKELRAITHSQADFTASESEADLFERIVSDLEGIPRKEAAWRARCSESMVARARKEAGREEEWGRPPRDASGLGRTERRRLVQSLAGAYASTRALAHALSLSYSTVLRDLERKG